MTIVSSSVCSCLVGCVVCVCLCGCVGCCASVYSAISSVCAIADDEINKPAIALLKECLNINNHPKQYRWVHGGRMALLLYDLRKSEQHYSMAIEWLSKLSTTFGPAASTGHSNLNRARAIATWMDEHKCSIIYSSFASNRHVTQTALQFLYQCITQPSHNYRTVAMDAAVVKLVRMVYDKRHDSNRWTRKQWQRNARLCGIQGDFGVDDDDAATDATARIAKRRRAHLANNTETVANSGDGVGISQRILSAAPSAREEKRMANMMSREIDEDGVSANLLAKYSRAALKVLKMNQSFIFATLLYLQHHHPNTAYDTVNHIINYVPPSLTAITIDDIWPHSDIKPTVNNHHAFLPGDYHRHPSQP